MAHKTDKIFGYAMHMHISQQLGPKAGEVWEAMLPHGVLKKCKAYHGFHFDSHSELILENNVKVQEAQLVNLDALVRDESFVGLSRTPSVLSSSLLV